MNKEKLNYELIDYEILRKARVSNGLSDRNILVPIEIYVGKKKASFDNLFSNNQDVNISSITQQELESKGKSILHKLSLALLLKGSFEIGDYSVDLYKISEKEYLSGLKDISKSQFYNDLPDFLKHLEIIQNIPVYESAAIVVSALSVLLGLYIGSKEKQTTALDNIIDFADQNQSKQLKHSNIKKFLFSYEWLYRFNILYDNLSDKCKQYGKKSIDFLKDLSDILLPHNLNQKAGAFFNKTKELIIDFKNNFSFFQFSNNQYTFRSVYKRFKFNLDNNKKIYDKDFNELNFFKNVIYNTHKDIEFKKTSAALNFAISTLFSSSTVTNNNILDKIKNRKLIKNINKSYEILKQISEISDYTSSENKSSIFLVQSEIAKLAIKAIDKKEKYFTWSLRGELLESIKYKIQNEIYHREDEFFIDFYKHKASNIDFLLLKDSLNDYIPNYHNIFQDNINLLIKKSLELIKLNKKNLSKKRDDLILSFNLIEEIKKVDETSKADFYKELYNIKYIHNVYKKYIKFYNIDLNDKDSYEIDYYINILKENKNINIDIYLKLIDKFKIFVEKTNEKLENHFNETDFEKIIRLTEDVVGEQYPYILKIKNIEDNILKEVNNYFDSSYFPFQNQILSIQKKIELDFSKKNEREKYDIEEKTMQEKFFKTIQIEDYITKEGQLIKAHTKTVWKSEQLKRLFYSKYKT